MMQFQAQLSRGVLLILTSWFFMLPTTLQGELNRNPFEYEESSSSLKDDKTLRMILIASKDKRWAIFGNSIVKVGDLALGGKVILISQDSVTILKNGQRHIYKLR